MERPKTPHCKRGHELSSENIKIRKNGICCRACLLINDKKYRDKKRKSQPAKTHCAKGHELSPENIKITKHGRHCRTCLSINLQKYRDKKKSTRAAKTHCAKGHELTNQNSGKRGCKICLRHSKSAWSRKKYETNIQFRIEVKERVYRYRKLLGLGKTKIEVGETFNEKLQRNDLYAIVNRATPKGLNPVARDDVIQSAILAILEGEISQSEISSAIKGFITSQYRDYDLASEHSKVKSLDAEAFDEGRFSLHETQNRNIWDM